MAEREAVYLLFLFYMGHFWLLTGYAVVSNHAGTHCLEYGKTINAKEVKLTPRATVVAFRAAA